MKALLPLALLIATPVLAEPEMPIKGTRLDVTATGQVDRVPDVATVAAGVVTQAGNAGEAMRANAARMSATIAALKRAGVADRDVQTAALSLQPQYRYGDNQPPTLTGYQASNRVSVRLRDLDHAGQVIDALVAAGANQIEGPSFAVDHPDTALDEARVQALASARARAELYAKAAGLHVGRIVRINEEGGGGAMPQPVMMSAMRKADTPIVRGEQTLSVTLSVMFELN